MSEENSTVTHTDEGSQNSTDFAVPGVSEFTPLPSNNESQQSWNKGLTKEDIAYMQRKYLHFIYCTPY